MIKTMINTPAEVVLIAPEALEVANCFLQTNDLNEVAKMLDISVETASSILSRREVKAYIDHVFLNTGFNNRFKLRELMDTLIDKKLQELNEADMGSSKDIAELLELSHKFTMSEYGKMIELEKLRSSNVKNQINVQVNDNAGTNYSALLEKLLKS